MSEERSNGGQAFPAMEVIEYGSGPRVEHHIGMTLRDYFAAKVVGDIALNNMHAGFHYNAPEAAALAYELADAMLAERAK